MTRGGKGGGKGEGEEEDLNVIALSRARSLEESIENPFHAETFRVARLAREGFRRGHHDKSVVHWNVHHLSQGNIIGEGATGTGGSTKVQQRSEERFVDESRGRKRMR